MLSGMEKYRSASKTTTYAEGLIDDANRTGSTYQYLRALGCTFDEGALKTKFHCPFGYEHSDGGKEKSARWYGDTQTAHCFALHGSLTPVKLHARLHGVSQVDAARKILYDAAPKKRLSYRQRMLETQKEVVHHPNLDYASAALRSSLLREYPVYAEAQYSKRVRDAMAVVLEKLDDIGHDYDSLARWVSAATRYVGTIAEKE